MRHLTHRFAATTLLAATLLAATLLAGLSLAAAETAAVVSTELTQVVSQRVEKTTNIPGELKPFQAVDLQAKVSGFVESAQVDRGSRVKAGDVLALLVAPELDARRAEAQARIATIQARLSEAEAKQAASQGTYDRLAEASKTPGVVAGNDVVLARKTVEADQAAVDALQKSILAAQAALRAEDETLKYLRVTAPFDGVITQRNADPGSLVGPQGSQRTPLFHIEQVDRLRLLAPVPEAYTESIRIGTRLHFTVPAFPGQTFAATVARPAFSIDPATRTMPVEADVDNRAGKLAPGMYAEIAWPLRRGAESLFVPASAIKATTERIFVIRVVDGKASWVDIRRGVTQGDLVEVFGDLHAGDTIVRRATDEIRPGTSLEPAQ
jgi:membrane fusion protein, multidrug efflux system